MQCKLFFKTKQIKMLSCVHHVELGFNKIMLRMGCQFTYFTKRNDTYTHPYVNWALIEKCYLPDIQPVLESWIRGTFFYDTFFSHLCLIFSGQFAGTFVHWRPSSNY